MKLKSILVLLTGLMLQTSAPAFEPAQAGTPNLSPLALQPFLWPIVPAMPGPAPVPNLVPTVSPFNPVKIVKASMIGERLAVFSSPGFTPLTNYLVLLDWNQPSWGVTTNNIYISPDGVSAYLVASMAAATNAGALLAGTNQIAVTAVDAFGNESDFSNWIQFPMPAPVTNVVIYWQGNRNVTLWGLDQTFEFEYVVTNVTGTNVVLPNALPREFFWGTTTDLPPVILNIIGQ